MLALSAKIRKVAGKKTKILREKDIIPAVLYGPDTKNLSLEIDAKDFDKIFNEAGESSLINLEIDGKSKKELQVLIHDIQKDPIKNRPIHVDFYLPPTKEEITVKVPIILEEEAPAVKELGGTLVRDIHEIEIRGLIKDLPKEIKVDISQIKTFEDRILIKDLNLPQGIKVLKNPEDIIISVSAPEKVEEELAKPVEEKVEEVEKVEKAEEKEEEEETTEETKEVSK